MTQPGARIIEAMTELKESRDAGEFVHELLEEVAKKYGVRTDELRKRAEASWGKPLETDPQRHAAHFEHVEEKVTIDRDFRKFADGLWAANLPGMEQFGFWEVNWARELDAAIETTEIEHPELEQIARSAFLDQVRRLEIRRKAGAK